MQNPGTTPKAPNCGPDKVAAYFEQLFHRSDRSSCLFLPSVMAIAKSLQCPPLDVHAAMQKLSERGFHFLMMGLDAPVTIRYLNRQIS